MQSCSVEKHLENELVERRTASVQGVLLTMTLKSDAGLKSRAWAVVEGIVVSERESQELEGHNRTA